MALPLTVTSGESDSSAEWMTEWKGICLEENREVNFIDGECTRHMEKGISTAMGTERRQEASTHFVFGQLFLQADLELLPDKEVRRVHTSCKSLVPAPHGMPYMFLVDGWSGLPRSRALTKLNHRIEGSSPIGQGAPPSRYAPPDAKSIHRPEVSGCRYEASLSEPQSGRMSRFQRQNISRCCMCWNIPAICKREDRG
jgi:hypothetical protein